MKISILLFDGVTALDAIGGYEVLARLPGASVEFFAKSAGIIGVDTRQLGLTAWKSFDEVSSTDMLYVPGGPGASALEKDDETLDQIRALDTGSRMTVGICNGVGVLAAAGILDGHSATTNFFYRDRLAAYGVDVVAERYHKSGKYITGAGVLASIDTALFIAAELAGPGVASTLQLGIEYYPDPPFPEKYPEDASDQAKSQVRMFEQTLGVAQLANPLPFGPAIEQIK